MATTFREFLINEVTVNFDPQSPDSLTQVRQDIRAAQQNPEKAQRASIQRAQDERRQAQQGQGQGPVAALQARIAQTKEYLARLEMQLSRLQQTTAATSQ